MWKCHSPTKHSSELFKSVVTSDKLEKLVRPWLEAHHVNAVSNEQGFYTSPLKQDAVLSMQGHRA